jgi:hypothetical protein
LSPVFAQRTSGRRRNKPPPGEPHKVGTLHDDATFGKDDLYTALHWCESYDWKS